MVNMLVVVGILVVTTPMTPNDLCAILVGMALGMAYVMAVENAIPVPPRC